MAGALAQTFYVKQKVNGTFATKVDLYFSQKDATFPVVVELREVINGIPSQSILPYSRKELDPIDVNVSTSAAVPTTFHFDAPVYLKNDTEYALAIFPSGSTPSYKCWVSQVGVNELGSSNLISKQPLSGILYTSTNNRNYVPRDDQDLKMTLYCTSFTEGDSGTVVLDNKTTDFLTLSDFTSERPSVGDIVYWYDGTDYTTLSDINANNIPHGEILHSYANNTFAIENLGLHSNNTGFVQFDNVGFLNATGTANVAIVNDYTYSTFRNFTSNLSFGPDKISANVATAKAIGASSLTSEAISPNKNHNLNSVSHLRSFSNAKAASANTVGVRVDIGISANTYNVGPMIDLTRASGLAISNYINNDATGEDAAEGGNALARYFTKKLILEDGQDAEDICVYLDGYKPSGTDIKVYYKIMAGVDEEDGGKFDDRSYSLMELEDNNTALSSSTNDQDYREYKYVIPSADLSGDDGEVEYTFNNTTFTGFLYFAIKIVLTSSNTALVPKVKNLRAIALQI